MSRPFETLPLADSDIRLFQTAFDATECETHFNNLRHSQPWAQDTLRLFGRNVKTPRLTAWQSDAAYRYSGVTHPPTPWTADVVAIKTRVETLTGTVFNSALLNLYRDGGDSMSWHADDERELGPDPAVASVSFGAARRFQLRRRDDKSQRHEVVLPSGSLLLMAGPTQHHWQHQLPKTKRAGERINLTFRMIRL